MMAEKDPSGEVKAGSLERAHVQNEDILVDPGNAPHLVQFYEDNEFLYETVSHFVGAGLAGGEGVILIATAVHLDGLRERLASNSFDVDRACTSGQLTFLDASETLARFMVGQLPDAERFAATMAPVIEQSRHGRPSGAVRAYREMVDVLCSQNNYEGALRLEQLWNDLAARHPCSLLCGYRMGSFNMAEHRNRFERVCHAHTHVLPTESSRLPTEDASSREIRLLQQRARALEVTKTLLRISTVLSSELDFDTLMQKLTDEATGLCRAQFGAFFYNVVNDAGESYMLYTLSGAPREAFAKFPMPRNTAVFETTFSGKGVVRLDDVTEDPRYGKNPPYCGMPKGHLPVKSYLAVPVKSRTGGVLGGLFLGHRERGIFTEADERLLTAISTHAAIAIENARLYQAARRAERIAEQERQRLHDLFVQAPAAISILRGPEHVFEFANPVARQLFGVDILGKRLREAVPDADLSRLKILDEIFRTGARYVDTEVVLPLDCNAGGQRRERFFNIVCEPYRDDAGTIAGVMCFTFEVTEQVLARHKVEAVVQELANANRMKDDFLATVSHELRTPLTAILGWTRALRTGIMPQDRREQALETIERNAKAQTKLIEDLLDVSRIISGKMRLEVKTVELPQVIANAIEAVRPAATAKGVDISQAIDPLVGPILGDADRLQQVVWNLLSNGVKFTPKGGSVQVALLNRDSFIEIIVADDGQGIDPAFLPHVFERFRQADATTARKHMGLGLGLAIVRHLVELHGGQVKVQSQGIGRGASFVVCLPISPFAPASCDRPPALRLATSKPEYSCLPELEAVRVLILEDDDDTRELLADILDVYKMRVSTAADVPGALQLIERAPPDIIVSDIGLSGEDGYVFIQKLRAIPANRGGKIPAIALTAYARVEDRTKALLAGFNMHIPKPVDPAELMAALSSFATLLQRA